MIPPVAEREERDIFVATVPEREERLEFVVASEPERVVT
jgi:hypothetical protein